MYYDHTLYKYMLINDVKRNLGSTHIGRNSDKFVNKDFQNGVMNIQGAGTSQLTDNEKAAVAPLRKDGKVAAKLKDDGGDNEDEDDCEDGVVSLHDSKNSEREATWQEQ
jgi:hypothetical protein